MRKLLTILFAVIALVAVTNAQDISSSIAPLYDGPNWGTISDTGITCSGGPLTSIIRDDGTYENGYRSVSTGDSTTMVQKMVMPSTPFNLQNMCVAWTALSPGGNVTFDLIMYDTTGAGGTPGNVVYRVNNMIANAVGIFPAYTKYTYPISFSATQRAYYVGVRWNNNPILPFFFAADENGPAQTMGPGYQRLTTTYPPAFTDVTLAFPLWKGWGVRLEGTAGSIQCNYTWVTQTSGTANLLQAVSAPSGNVCWIAGATATVRLTTNGGTTWVDGNPNPGVITGDVYGIWAVDATTAILTTSPAATFMYRTTNAGSTWVQVFTQTGGFIDAIVMTSPTVGYAYGDPVGSRWSLWKTVNGGVTWDSAGMYLPQVATEAGWNNAMCVIGNNIWFGTNNTKVYHSTNAGLTGSWVGGVTTGNVSTYGVWFTSATNGICVGTIVQKTTDGGTTWVNGGTVAGTGNMTSVGGQGTNFWLTRGTNVYGSTDFGTTWTGAGFTGTQALWATSITSATCLTGWSVGAAGTLLKLNGVPVGISNNNNQLPSSYKLEQNYPNPFNPTTNITFALPVAGNVELKVYDLLGREVTTLVNNYVNAGTHIVPFDASSLASGVYIYKINAGTFTDSRKMVLIK